MAEQMRYSDIPEQITIQESNESVNLYCSICAQVIASYAIDARPDLVEDEAFFHSLKCPPSEVDPEHYLY